MGWFTVFVNLTYKLSAIRRSCLCKSGLSVIWLKWSFSDCRNKTSWNQMLGKQDMGTSMHFVCIAVASFVLLAQPAVAQGVNTTLPLIYPGQVSQGDDNQTCPSEEQRGMLRNKVDNATLKLLRKSVVPFLQGYSCGGSTGWRRVAYLNMSDPSQQCPSAWQEITTPHRVCRRTSISTQRANTAGCDGVTYTTGSEQYNQVCGRIIGYQYGIPYAFNPFAGSSSIDGVYVVGVSVTHGSPRQHIWTFAGGFDEQDRTRSCPCVAGSTNGNHIPSFVGQNYFCESGITRWPGRFGTLWSNGDPLWDGQGCGPTSSCCTFNSPPWFNVQLPSPTTDGIEVRLCGEQSNQVQFDDTPVQLVELYVKWIAEYWNCLKLEFVY